MTARSQEASRRRWVVGLILASSFLLAGCFDCGEPLGVTGVVVESDRMVAYVVYDDVLEGPLITPFVSTDRGESWSYLELGIRSDPEFEVPKSSSWCHSNGCYEIERLSLVRYHETHEGEVLWEPPPGRVEFVENGAWGRSDRPCLAAQEGPMALHSVDGGTVGGHEVVVVAAGLDGVLLRVDGSEVTRVGVGTLTPRPFASFGDGLRNAELVLPTGIAAVALVLAAFGLAGIYRHKPSRGGMGWTTARFLLWLVAILVALVGALLAVWFQAIWLSVTIIAWMIALGATYGRRGDSGEPPILLLLVAWALPATLGWLPLLGWSVGVPASRSVAMVIAAVASMSSAVLAIAIVRSRLHTPPSVLT